MKTMSMNQGNARSRSFLPAQLVSFGKRVEPQLQSLVLVALRAVYGWFFVQTGWGKLTHLERTTEFFSGLGLPLPKIMALQAGGTELVGGALLLLGLGGRFAAAALTGVMLVALATAHASEAFQSLESLTEQAPYPFLVACLVVLAFGTGRLSVDAFLSRGAAEKPHT